MDSQTIVLEIIKVSNLLRREYRGRGAYPNYNGTWLVRCTNLEVSSLGDVIEEELEQELRLLILEADDTLGEARVDVQCLLARHRVLPDDRVLALDGLAPDWSSAFAGMLGLWHCRVHGAKTLETFLEFVREPVVRLNLRQEEGVAATTRRLVEDPEECRTRGLLLV